MLLDPRRFRAPFIRPEEAWERSAWLMRPAGTCLRERKLVSVFRSVGSLSGIWPCFLRRGLVENEICAAAGQGRQGAARLSMRAEKWRKRKSYE